MDLYYHPAPPPSRAVLMTVKALGLDPNLKIIDVMTGESLKPEFVKINPQHTVPTLVDNGFVLWESKAIMIYLAEKYGKNSKSESLFPRMSKTRAIVNQRLFFDMGTLIPAFGKLLRATTRHEDTTEASKEVDNALAHLEEFLDHSEYAACHHLTLADIALVSTVSGIEVLGVDFAKFTNIVKWYQNCRRNIPGYDVNDEGLTMMKNYLSSLK